MAKNNQSIRKMCVVMFREDRGIALTELMDGSVIVDAFRPPLPHHYEHGRKKLKPVSKVYVKDGRRHAVVGFSSEAMRAITVAHERLSHIADGNREETTLTELDLPTGRIRLLTKVVDMPPVL